MNRKLKVYECKISGIDDTGIFAMSFVDVPANEKNFVALKSAKKVQLHTDKMRQVLTGAVLIPDQVIYRNDSYGEYYIKFTAADIEKIAHKMMRKGIALSTTTHQHEKPLDGNYLVECWIVEDPKKDKSVALGLGEMPKGTLMASYKITSPAYWRGQVLAGKVKGFSIEGFFNFKNVNMNKNAKPAAKLAAKNKKPNAVATFMRSMAAMLDGDSEAAAEALADEAAKDETDSGTPLLVFELSDGTEIHVDEEGNATIDGEAAPAGTHALADGNFIEIDENSVLVVTTPEEDAPEPESAEAALAAAKEKGKEFAAAFAKLSKGKTTPKDAQIAKLQAQINALKKDPSAKPVKAGAHGLDDVDPATLSHSEKIALVLQKQREARKGK